MDNWLSYVVAQIERIPSWAILAAIAGVAILAALAAHRLVFFLLERQLRDSERFAWLLILKKSKAPSAFAAVMAALSLSLQLGPISGTAATGLTALMQIAFITLLTWLAIVTTEIFSSVYIGRLQRDLEENLLARKHVTQIRILTRAAVLIIALIGLASALMSFDAVRQYGVSLFASAGVAGLAIGLAARPLLSNLIAGVQIAMTQPIRIQDSVIVEGDYGTIEEINSTYVVVQLWDWRRLILPLNYFIEKPFQNWSRDSESIIGSVMIYVDYCADVPAIRKKLEQLVKTMPLWDGKVVNLQVSDATETSMQLRILVSARTAASAWDLRCLVREALISFVSKELRYSLPQPRRQIASHVWLDEASLVPEHALPSKARAGNG
ncbi:mechanosensitive ion channel [Bradyrhizobium sp. AUGA SZCCT0240]|uniref:mechanosensitive ion channel family protein n=1 Tax=Bradyrhizobium sp. AUGA SZCCT0240 TaxID=2807669 RepID=UPI001BAC5713|nr:mechanosensitive ion channel domain-containing protein [Bradyrhizobium sp. AUGA SZCCT0240]MBR1253015.1 mechanosensitive ion channel [Bradyrhizobium sp. AUGA SZCCT0240]